MKTKNELIKEYETLYGIKPSNSLSKHDLEVKIESFKDFQCQSKVFKIIWAVRQVV